MFKKTLFIALTLLISGQVHAATIDVYTDRTTWESALAGATINTETFSNPIAAADVITLDNGIVSTASPLGLGSIYNSVSGVRYRGYTCLNPTPCPPGSATADVMEHDWALPSATYALGADFVNANPQGVKIDIDALGYIGTAINSSIGGTDGFYGIISDTLFDNIDLRCASTSCGDAFWIDNFSSASDIPAVPVPAAVWLFGTALIGFVGMSRRRKVA